MSVLASRVRSRSQAALGRLAELAGVAVRQIGRGLPGIAGPLLICWGLGLAWLPLGLIAAGTFLLLLDRRVS